MGIEELLIEIAENQRKNNDLVSELIEMEINKVSKFDLKIEGNNNVSKELLEHLEKLQKQHEQSKSGYELFADKSIKGIRCTPQASKNC